MPFHVYCIINAANGKEYVGVTTKGYKNRFASHLWHARKEAGSCRALYAAIRKYGSDCFSVKLLSTASSFKHMNELERKYIADRGSMYPNGYNLTDGGDAGVFVEDTRRMMSERLKGKPMSQKNKAGLLKAWSNPEIRERRRAAIKAAMNRPEVRENTGKRQRGVPKDESHILALRASRASPVICVETARRFDAVIDAVNWVKCQGEFPKANHAKIIRALKRDDYTAYGYHWKRADA